MKELSYIIFTRYKSLPNYIFLGFTFVIVSLALYASGKEYYALSFFLFLIPVAVIMTVNFDRYFAFYFTVSLMINFYLLWSIRLQLVNVISLFMFFVYLTNSKSEIYNNYDLPTSVKLSGIVLFVVVMLSEILSPYNSALSVYFGILFGLFMLSSFIFFKYVKNQTDISNLLDLFLYGVFFSGILIILQIIISGDLRSVGLVGFAIMDFSAIAMLILLFKYFILERPSKVHYYLLLVIFLVFITTQSRFAWLGFLIAFVFGIIISVKHKDGVKKFIGSKLFILFAIVLFLVGISVLTGLSQIVLSRIGNISLNVLQPDDSGSFVNNSLDTRLLIWIVALNTFINHPIIGVGYQMFAEVSYNYNILPEYLFENYVYKLDAHTTYLNFLVETGLIGLTSFLTYVIIIFRLSYKSLLIAQTEVEKNNSIILNILVFFVAVHSIYSGAFTFGQNAFQMHALFGITVANYSILKYKTIHYGNSK